MKSVVPAGRVYSLAWLLLATLLVGCSNLGIEGQELAAKGIATADKATIYYAALEEATQETVELEYLRLGLSKKVPTPENLKKYDQRLEALAARKNLVGTLKQTYESLGDLSAYDAKGQVETAAGALATSIDAVVKSPFPNIGIDLKALFANALTLIGQARKNADIRKGAAALEEVVTVVIKILEAEMEPAAAGLSQSAYNAILVEREEMTKNWLLQADQTKILDYEEIINGRLKSYGWKVDLTSPRSMEGISSTVQRNTRDGLYASVVSYDTRTVQARTLDIKKLGADVLDSARQLLADHKALFPTRR